MNNELYKEFCKIKKKHKDYIIRHCAVTVPGPSVIRVFNPGTDKIITNCLLQIPVKELQNIQCQEEFKAWFEKHLKPLSREIRKNNRDRSIIMPGYKWGHSTKVLCLFLRKLVSNTHYFDEKTSERLSFFLYCPIDGKIIGRLNKLHVRPGMRRIKDISSEKLFYGVQRILDEEAIKAGVPRVWFDDNWSKRQDSRI